MFFVACLSLSARSLAAIPGKPHHPATVKVDMVPSLVTDFYSIGSVNCISFHKNFIECIWAKYSDQTAKVTLNGGLVRESPNNAFTLPETNIAPKNRHPQYESSIPTIHF